MQNAKQNTTFFPHSPTTCPSKHTKRIAKKYFSIFWEFISKSHFFSKKVVAQGVYLPVAVKGLRVIQQPNTNPLLYQ
jgi:hypothetical protein